MTHMRKRPGHPSSRTPRKALGLGARGSGREGARRRRETPGARGPGAACGLVRGRGGAFSDLQELRAETRKCQA